MPLYFAYGSNMALAPMAARCPASRPIGPARLARHRFVIMREGFASVARDPRAIVWGVLWDLALADMPALDRYEAVAAGLYTKLQQPIVSAAGPRRALVYIGRNAGPGRARPGYLEDVVAAGRAAGLPDGYLREVERWRPAVASRVSASVAALPAGDHGATVRPTRRSPLDPAPVRPGNWGWEP